MHVFTIEVTRKLNRLITFVYNVMTTALMSLVWPPGSNTTMWVGQEVLMDKRSGGKFGVLVFFLIIRRYVMCDYATLRKVLS